MRYITNLFQTPITRVFSVRGATSMGVASVSAWSLDGAPLFATKLWPVLGEELGADAALDMGIPKSRAEWVVTGRAFAPAGEAARTVPVQVRIGSSEKRIHAIGDRRWTELGTTDPEPFAEMPLRWEHAFGGAGFAPNPIGKGVRALEADEGSVHPLPNLEMPGRLVTSPNDRPTPASFGPIDLSWPQRFDLLGTYDMRWYEERFPAFADDIDWRFFNVASTDQQLDRAEWAGDEAFVLEGLHLERPHIEGRLPGVCVRCFVTRGPTPMQEAELVPVPMRLTTVWFLPHRELYVLIHHGAVDVERDDGSDLSGMVSALERIGQTKSIEHYRDVVRKRLDPEWGALHALRDIDLMPAAMRLPTLTEAAALTYEPDDLLRKNLQCKAQRALEELREQVRASGLDPDKIAPIPPPETEEPIDLNELPAMLERIQERAELERVLAEEKLAAMRAQIAERLNLAGIETNAAPEPQGPARFTAAGHYELLSAFAAQVRRLGKPAVDLEQQLADPALHRRLLAQEMEFREAYRSTGHCWPPTLGREHDADSVPIRDRVLEHIREGWSLADQDLTGADLSNLDLRGAELRGAWLEGANLQSADLSDVDLRGAILVRADLSDATLNGTRLAGANLGSARMLRVQAPKGVDLRHTILVDTDLRGALLPGALLSEADLTQARFEGTELSGIQAPGITLMRTSLKGTRLRGVDFTKANLLYVELDEVDLTGAKLWGAVFVSCRGEGACFDEADLGNAPMVVDCAFERASFRRANLTMANLRGVRLTGCDFTQATLDNADLSEAVLDGAVFHRAIARRSRFVRANLTDASMLGANLMDAILQEATLAGTDLRGANLFQADLWKVKSDARTSVRDALVKRTRFVPKERLA